MRAKSKRYGNAYNADTPNEAVIARRMTIDGYAVLLWADGAVSDRNGHLVKGRVPKNRLWDFAGWVATYKWAELPRFIDLLKKGKPILGIRDDLAPEEIWAKHQPTRPPIVNGTIMWPPGTFKRRR